MSKDEEATEKQYFLMDKLGIEYNKEGVTVGEASALIKAKLESNKPKDISSQYQSSPVVHKDESQGIDRDRLIVRQNCKDSAIEIAKMENAKWRDLEITDDVEAILKLAERLEKWVFR